MNDKINEQYLSNKSLSTKEVKTLKESFKSATTFFSIAYAIILSLSICYNIGYFRYLNPQIVELMTLSDYIHDTIHNIWFFLIAGLLFFCSSLGAIKKQLNSEFNILVSIGLIIFTISSYIFIQGITKSKLWPALKLFASSSLTVTSLIVIIVIFVIIISVISYKFAFKVSKKDISTQTISIIPLIAFLLIVLLPYFIGMSCGYLETKYLKEKDYQAQTVNIVSLSDEIENEVVVIIKSIEKGLVVRKFIDQQISEFVLLSWGDIKQINYQPAH